QELKFFVVDDHELMLGGTVNLLQQKYPQAKISMAQTAENIIAQIEEFQPDLVVIDLSLPKVAGEIAQTDTGIQLLKTLMQNYPQQNFLVQSTYVKTLVRIQPEIDAHEGGFTIADKGISSQEMLTRVAWALQGITHTKDLRNGPGLEIKKEWLTLLNLAFREGLQDKAIAERMNISERTVRYYWNKIQDSLEVYPDNGKNIRIQTEMRAREVGLID
ncbi:MAG: response regulator transcription factor, partial [Okeania sp. SIO2D1]|nr:response regulator transcription factor [Okeania sp. SIO2D1]